MSQRQGSSKTWSDVAKKVPTKRYEELKNRPMDYDRPGNRYKPDIPWKGQQGGKYPLYSIKMQRAKARYHAFHEVIKLTHAKVVSAQKSMLARDCNILSIVNVCNQWETLQADNLVTLLDDIDTKFGIKNKRPGSSIIGQKDGKKVYFNYQNITDEYLDRYPLCLTSRASINNGTTVYSLF